MNDATRGLYGKYRVERSDGSSAPGGKHHECEYFVLDLNHDKHARKALMAYAESCHGEFQLLANDLRDLCPEEDSKMSSEQAISAARAILADLSDRRGVGDELGACDPEVQEEMVQTWATIIHCAVNKKGIE